MKFNSQICTTREQSERLLALGLKKETADMCWQTTTLNGEPITYPSQDVWMNGSIITNNHFPAWSLHRLIEMMPKSIHFENEDWYKIIYNNSVCYQRGQFSICCSRKGDLYADIINCIEWLIKEESFPKEYLEE